MATLQLHILPGQSADKAISIAINEQGALCSSWKGNGNQDICLIFNTDQASPNWSWNDYVKIPNASTNHAPAVVFYGERLFIAWISADGKNNVCYTFTDNLGQNFGSMTVLENTHSKTSPGLTAGKSLFISFTDESGLLNVMSVG